MLLHDYLKLKSAILTKAKAEVDNLLKDIADPKMKEAVDDWDLGDPINDLYPQKDQTVAGLVKSIIPAPQTEAVSDPAAQAAAKQDDQTNHTV